METAIKGVSEVNKIAVVLLKEVRLFYTKLFKSSDKKHCLKLDYHGQAASDYIKKMLASNKPCMICRIGSNELKATLNYLDIISNNRFVSKSIKYIRSDIGPLWWDEEINSIVQKRLTTYTFQEFDPFNLSHLNRNLIPLR